MFSNNPWLTVGKIVGAHGLKGELKVNPLTDFAERFTNPGIRWVQGSDEDPKKINLICGRKVPGKSLFIVNFSEVNNRNETLWLIGKKVLVQSHDRPKLAKGEFHLLDLVGLEARLTANGPSIGKVINLQTAGNDLLEIKLLEGKTVLIPFVKEIIPQVKLEEGWLLITPPPGLLEL